MAVLDCTKTLVLTKVSRPYLTLTVRVVDDILEIAENLNASSRKKLNKWSDASVNAIASIAVNL